MSALLTHAAAGLVVGLALGLRARDLPLAAFLACLPDLDHLQVPGLVARGTLTNVFVCIAIPAAVALFLLWRGLRGPWLRVALAAPVLLTTHLVLDMLPLDPLGDAEGVRLLYPFDDQRYFVQILPFRGMDPLTVSTFTLVLAALALAILGTTFVLRRAESPTPRAAWTTPTIFAAAWLLLLPATALSGLVGPLPDHPNANLALEDARAQLPDGRFIAIVHHAGGRRAGAGSLEVQLFVDGAKAASATNPKALNVGDRWVVDVPADLRGHSLFTAKLVATTDAHAYADARVPLTRGHVESALRLARAGSGVALANDGPLDVPPGALRATATGLDGATRMNATNDAAIKAGSSWTLPADALSVRFTVLAVDDGHAYMRDATA